MFFHEVDDVAGLPKVHCNQSWTKASLHLTSVHLGSQRRRGVGQLGSLLVGQAEGSTEPVVHQEEWVVRFTTIGTAVNFIDGLKGVVSVLKERPSVVVPTGRWSHRLGRDQKLLTPAEELT